MVLQTQNLVMINLGVLGDKPPNDQLQDGIHLRWAFKHKLGFPWYGFYLFRRPNREGNSICLSQRFAPGMENIQKFFDQQLGIWLLGSTTLHIPDYGQISSDQNLSLTDKFAPSGSLEFSLYDRSYLRFTLPLGKPARRVDLHIGFNDPGKVEVTTVLLDTSIIKSIASGDRGEIVTVTLEDDNITIIELKSGPAVLLDICYWPVLQDAGEGWEEVKGFPYPMCLPVAHEDYSCPGAPATQKEAENVAIDRIVYGEQDTWRGDSFNQLHQQLIALVEGGPPPIGKQMAERSLQVKFTSRQGGLTASLPSSISMRPLDLVLLETLNPAVAQMVGLYWVDKTAKPGVAYDYIILADHKNIFDSDFKATLNWLKAGDFKDVDGYIIFNKILEPAPPLPPPDHLHVYALPSATVRDNNVGLRWELDGANKETSLSAKPIMYHVWRASLGNVPQGIAPSIGQYRLITEKAPLV